MTAPQTVADLLSRCLLAQGARRAFRAPGCELPPLVGLDEVAVPTAELASLLADADGRLSVGPTAGPGVALLPGHRVRLSSQPFADVEPQAVLDVGALPAAVAGWSLGEVHAAAELDLFVDLTAPAPADVEPLALATTSDELISLSPTLADFRTVLLVGPGVVRAGQGPAVAEAAAHTGAGVVATFGAVGVLPPDHPSWLGVVGLQDLDGERSGLADAELIIAAGVDPAEVEGLVPDTAQVLDVEPWHLALMASLWPDPASLPGPSPLVEALAALTAPPLDPTLPIAAVRASTETLHAVGAGGVVAADPGPAGLWVSRGLAPSAATVVVPALAGRGAAAALALVAALDGRPALAVVTAPVDPLTEQALDLAAALATPLVVAVWGAEASWEGPEEHLERLALALGDGGQHRVGVPVDLSGTRALVDIAGPVAAWSGPRS